jgi:predicted ATP-grasp superfamily ATP-dependent carboligase
MIQERIVGLGTGIFVLCDHGEPLTAFAHRRLREKPPSGGASVLSESVPTDPALIDEAMRLLRPLGWHGVAMIEYKQDVSSGRSVLMEINGRFWGSLQLAIDSGVDFPAMAFDLARGRRPQAPDSYKVGVRSRWLLGDLDHLLARLFHRREEQYLAEGAPSRVRACFEFLKIGGRDLQYDVMSRDDPQPGIHEVGEYVADLSGSAGRMAARLMNRFAPRSVSPNLALSHLNQRERGRDADAID